MLISSRLCKWCLIGLPGCSIKLVQKVQNMAAKLVLNLEKHDSSTEALKTLQWLPIKQQIEYKIINLTQQCIHGQAPNYLKKLLEINKLHQAGQRSSSTGHKWDLKVKFTGKRTFTDRSFLHCCTQIMEPITSITKRNYIK